jgi:hypothetical protein
MLQVRFPRSYADLRSLGAMLGISLPPTLRQLIRGGPRDHWRFVKTFLSGVRRSAEVVRANVEAEREYVPQTLDCRPAVILFGHSGAKPDRKILGDLEKFVTRGVDIHVVPGNHMSVLDRARVPALAAVLNQRLAAAADRPARGASHHA